MMQAISINLRERTTLRRTGEVLRFGVPLAKGAIFNPGRLQLSTLEGSQIPAQFQPLVLWPDNSIRWVCVDALLTAQAQPSLAATLHEVEPDLAAEPSQTSEPCTSQDNGQLKIQYGGFLLSVDDCATTWHWSDSDNQAFSSQLTLRDDQDLPCTPHLDAGWHIANQGPVLTTLETRGWWLDHLGQKLARFQCELNFNANGLITVDATIHNPNRARHPGGLWDLGDEGSIRFGSMAIVTDMHRNERLRIALSIDDEPEIYSPGSPLRLQQESSGGANWNSRNHVNAEGRVLPRYRGYRLQHGTDEPQSGLRANPVLEASSTQSSLTVSIPHFWQNFPSALYAHDSTISAFLFPEDKPEPYELQGGERKTQRVILGYGKRLEELLWSQSPSIPVLAPAHYESTAAFPYFRADQPETTLDKLIQEGMEGPSNFFAKREVIDEYGWRNFGDIFADHETLYQADTDEPYITHYNNQYDAVYGLARRFALTGDPRWFELMDDLANHVSDIDIYHTVEDRVEYNNGLFWHTDHYLDAKTATHRTFSRHNDTSSTPGQTGGGPGAEHCYTSGHLYHYLLTGNNRSKEAVLELAQWITNSHEGAPGLLAELLALKKQEIPKLRALLKGEYVTTHRYPFTRGTGNYLNALLDAHYVEPDKGWLQRAEAVIRGTIHPADDINKRNLMEVETGWSYLILLTSIVKYINLKADTDGRDEHWRYATASFLHYTQWMRDNERPFLDDPEALEFANQTWVAQDIRKAMLMFQAANLAPDSADSYVNKGQEWLTYVTDTLKSTSEASLARLLIILMQNDGAQHLLAPQVPRNHEPTISELICYKAPVLSVTTLLGRIALRLMTGAWHFSLRQEKAWLQARLERS